MVTRADELFKLLEDGGEQAIDRLISEGATEELFLDFKRSATNGQGVSLSAADRNNYAKALSGFGNSEGGVIVWGVDCRRNADGADVPIGKVPLENPTRFRSWLEAITSGLTVPPHGAVRHIAIRAAGAGGFVISLIPKSNYSPHQTVTDSRYLMRAGSSFLPVPHAVLAGMFGRRPQPRIIENFVTGNPRRALPNGATIEVAVLLINVGQGIAEHLFLNLSIWSKPGPNCAIELNRPDANQWDGTFGFGTLLSLIARDGVRLAPMARAQPTTIAFTLLPPFDRPLKIEGLCGCVGAENFAFMIEATAAELTQSVAAFDEAAQRGLPLDDVGRTLANVILKPPVFEQAGSRA